MAKKSAKSKGFRKQQTKKPYLTKRDIVVLCLLVAVLAAGAIVAATYNDGALKLTDGRVADAGDNWLIVNGAAARGRARYFKVGEVAEIEGFTRENTPLADVNVPQYVYTPAGEGAVVDSVTITASHVKAQALAEYVGKAMAGVDNTEVSDIATHEVDGQSYVCVSTFTDLTAAAEEAEAESSETAEAEPAEAEGESSEPAEAEASETEAEPAETEAEPAETEAEPAKNFSKTFRAYLDCAHESSVVVDINATAETKEALPDDAAMQAAAEQAIAAVTLEPVK